MVIRGVPPRSLERLSRTKSCGVLSSSGLSGSSSQTKPARTCPTTWRASFQQQCLSHQPRGRTDHWDHVRLIRRSRGKPSPSTSSPREDSIDRRRLSIPPRRTVDMAAPNTQRIPSHHYKYVNPFTQRSEQIQFETF